ncbi:agamous-like MADS-box protein AGL62 [Apium graveolens]|uniref:agamous-like MADS-box protein AGL62 n=1 Tax=Apium graveolens TaxID=4045 RepID=UPI003D793C3E
MPRINLGRRKITMRRMTNESNLAVTFSKRRAGLFNKATEICTLCGVKIAIIIFSPGEKKVYSFGHPNLELLIDKFILPQDAYPVAQSGVLEQVDPPILAELNGHLSMLHDHLETERTSAERLEKERSQRPEVDWFEAPVEDLGLEQLQMLKSGLTGVRKMVANRRDNLAMTQQAQDLTGLSLEGGEPADGPDAAFGIVMTPQGSSKNDVDMECLEH